MKTKIWIALLALYIVWGSTYLAIRFTVETMPPFLQASLRFLVSGAILFAWRRSAGDPIPTLGNWKSTAIVGTFLLVGGNGLVSLAEKTVPSGIAALVIATSPFWLVLFEAFRSGGVKPTWQAILGLIVGFGGVFLLIGPADCADPLVTGLDLRQRRRHAEIGVAVHRDANVDGSHIAVYRQRGNR